ncbi:MAG: hypothetical protein ACTSRS_09945 [Candidatus Helarchaeota archaeon]
MVAIELGAEEQKVLKALKSKSLSENELKRKKIKDVSILERLLEKEVVKRIEPTGRARVVKWGLTERGKELAAQIAIAPAPKKRGKKKQSLQRTLAPTQSSPQALTLEDILQVVTNYCTPYFKRYNQLLDDLTEKVNYLYSKGKLKRPAMELLQFQKMVKEIYQHLNIKNNYGEVVPIPLLKQELLEKTPGLSTEDFNTFLLKLEEKRVLDLQIASDPTKVPDAQEGIAHPQRGLIYYVVWRREK